MSFEECRVYARSLQLKGREQWKSHAKSGQLNLRCPGRGLQNLWMDLVASVSWKLT